MYKVITVNSNGKIELTKEELQKLLDEAYEDGLNQRLPSNYPITYPSITPYNPYDPYITWKAPDVTCTTADSKNTIADWTRSSSINEGKPV